MAAVAAVVSAVASVAGAIVGAIGRHREAEEQKKELETQADIVEAQKEEAEAQTAFDVANIRLQGERQEASYIARTGAAGVRGATTETVQKSIESETERYARRRQEGGETQTEIFELQKGLLTERKEYIESNQWMNWVGMGLDILGTTTGGIYNVGTELGWWDPSPPPENTASNYPKNPYDYYPDAIFRGGK